ncbi:AraC family transcriptional regulator [Niabella beijingensis]|uniref:AraC family transcriptional regulator n=1 Tax=Niabella beijingensis TaxID=2872700 RepID=UPI001CBF50E6|nr:AraC family transcriptional regulator [Niabella beijingensis]MBZ4190527.1 AraC family transcriptional regulator [Niabella beijingensis]
MKAILQKVPVLTNTSFALQHFSEPYFNIPWHFHPECELVLIHEGSGKKFIGNTITDFAPGSLVLIGPDLPHWYRCDDIFYHRQPGLKAASTVIQFEKHFLGDGFLQAPELGVIREMLDSAAMGLEITGSCREDVSSKMLKMDATQGMERLLLLLSILHRIAASGAYHTLSTQESVQLSKEDSHRINKIYEFVMDHFTEDISTETVAGIVNMSASAFCRYFKKRTRKTFIVLLNEIRVGHACRLLIEQENSITDVCFSSGFNNVSYFNRQFLAVKGMSPKQFRNAYQHQAAQKTV